MGDDKFLHQLSQSETGTPLLAAQRYTLELSQLGANAGFICSSYFKQKKILHITESF